MSKSVACDAGKINAIGGQVERAIADARRAGQVKNLALAVVIRAAGCGLQACLSLG